MENWECTAGCFGCEWKLDVDSWVNGWKWTTGWTTGWTDGSGQLGMDGWEWAAGSRRMDVKCLERVNLRTTGSGRLGVDSCGTDGSVRL